MRFAEFQKNLGFKMTKDVLSRYAKRFNLKFKKTADGKNEYSDRDIILTRLIWALTHKIKLKDPEIMSLLDAITVGSYKRTLDEKINPQKLYRDNLELRQEVIDGKRERDHLDKEIKEPLKKILEYAEAGGFVKPEKRRLFGR